MVYEAQGKDGVSSAAPTSRLLQPGVMEVATLHLLRPAVSNVDELYADVLNFSGKRERIEVAMTPLGDPVR